MKEAPAIIFLGTPEFAVSSLRRLVEHGYDIAAVVTAPDQPAGRGQQIKASPVKNYAISRNLRVLQPEKLKNPDFIRTLEEINADLFIVVAFRMLPEAVWSMPPLGTFNLHASLLPQYRGAAPINHAIINGENETGITTFFLKQEIDTGAIIFQERVAILPQETSGELHDRLMETGAGLVIKTTQAIFEGKAQTTEQSLLADGTVLKPAPKIFKDDCHIDWRRKSLDIFNMIRGLSPYPAAFTHFIPPAGASHMVKIFRAELQAKQPAAQPASIITDGKTHLSVATIDGMLDIKELQLSGKRPMKIEEFLRGFRINSDWKAG